MTKISTSSSFDRIDHCENVEGKNFLQLLIYFSQSVTSSPALSRKSSKTNIKSSEGFGKNSKSNLTYNCDKGYNDRVSEDINDMVEQIQAIQNDISELAGRPISLIDYKH